MQLNDKDKKEAESLFTRQVESFLSGVIDVTCRTDDVLLRVSKFLSKINLNQIFPRVHS